MDGDFRIGEWLVQPQLNTIRDADKLSQVEPKAMEVLLYLARHAGEVVTKERLMQAVWADAFVTDEVLTNCIWELRKALCDDAKKPRVIQTVFKRGYRLIAPVTAVATKAAAPGISRWVGVAAILTLALGTAVGLWMRFGRERRRTETEPPAALLKTVPFTSFPGVESQPAISPDGKQIAFVWEGEKGGNFDIYVKLVEGGSPLRLTSNPADDFSPAWSPDGSRIAFLRESERGSEILLVSALGGPERKVGQTAATLPAGVVLGGWAQSGLGLAWSPDGKLLAVVDKDSPQDPDSISLVTVKTGERHKLTLVPDQYFGDRFPAFSPDGKSLAFARFRSFKTSDIYMVAVAGGGTRNNEPERLTSDGVDIAGLDWSSDGRSIVFSSDREGRYVLWRIPVSGGVAERLATGGEPAFWPSVARRGDRLAYSQGVLDANIWRAAGSLAGVASETNPERFISSTRWDGNPDISPDGKRIAFTSVRSGSAEIWVCDQDGSDPVRLTSFGSGTVGSPRWSPDGKQIAFDSRAHGQPDIYLVSPDEGVPRRVTTEPSNEVRPSWSKDGRWIYFGSDRTGAWQVWKIPRKGGAAVQLTEHGGREARESPHGQFVYYAKLGSPGIWRVPAGGGDEVQVLDQGDPGHWAVLDQGIVFLSRKAMPQPAVELFSFATRRMEKIALLPNEARRPTLVPALAVTPDMRLVLYLQMDEVSGDIVLVENFR